MKKAYLFLLALTLAFHLSAPLGVAGTADCDKLKSTILQIELGIKASEDMMEKNPAQDTPKFRADVAKMKALLAENKAKFKSMNCAGGQPELDKTVAEKYGTTCGRVKSQIELDQDNITLADHTLAKMTDPDQVKQLKKTKEAFLADLKKQKQLLVKYGCK